MSGDNPFEVSPDGYGDRSGYDRGVVTAEVSTRTIELLNQTRPWVQLIGILLWIGTVIIAFVAVFGVIGAIMAGHAGGFFIAAIQVVVLFVYGLLARSLTTYASHINRLNVSERIEDLEEAVASQKTFWKTVGIITVIYLIMIIVIVGLSLAGATFFMRWLERA